MSVVIRWECDHCGRDADITAEEPSRVLSMYMPQGWGQANTGFRTPYKTFCSVTCYEALKDVTPEWRPR
jgi:hypothetical protein